MTALSLVTWLLGVTSPVALAPAPECPALLLEAIHAELDAAGLPAVAVAEDAAPLPGEVARVSLRCAAAPRQVEARISDRVTDKVVARTIPLSADLRGASRVATAVADLLHASLAETRYAQRARPPPPVARFVESRAPEAATPWRLAAAGGAAFAPGGFGAQPLLGGWLERRVGPLALGGRLDATVRATRLLDAAGTADVGLVLGRGTLSIPFALGAWSLTPTVGVGALLAWVVGLAQPGFVARTSAATTLLLAAGLRLERPLPGHLALGASLEVGSAVGPVVLQLPGSVSRVGAPLFTLCVSLSTW